ncbi:MAG: hypothetical protein M0C28_25160 [Candidatus Moduliflexus flocculans]|nr:hypothetical protein [Candidatus Moduliflexus flocculans]
MEDRRGAGPRGAGRLASGLRRAGAPLQAPALRLSPAPPGERPGHRGYGPGDVPQALPQHRPVRSRVPVLDLALHRGDPPGHQLVPEEEDRRRTVSRRGGRRCRRSGGRAAGGGGYDRAVGLRQDSRGEPVPRPVAPLRRGHGGRGDRPGRRQKPGRREPAPAPGPDEHDEEDRRRARRGDGIRQARGGERTDGRMKEGRTIMLCHLARRAISRSEDRGKALPRWAGRHIGRCEACREYARFADS